LADLQLRSEAKEEMKQRIPAAILILGALLIILHHFIITGRFFDIGDMLHHEFFEGMLLAAGLALLASSYLNEK